MIKNPFSQGIINMSVQDFMACFDGDEDNNVHIIGQPARLIPIGKKDDEMAMTTVFLSSMRLIKEFRQLISEPISLSKSGSLLCFTEVSFPLVFGDDEIRKNCRFDGLVLVVSGNKIKDAAIFEMKQGNNSVEKEQIERYLEMARILGIPKLVSISNQFVTVPTNYPIQIEKPKAKNTPDLYHYSWTYIAFLAEILLKDNNVNIVDQDQYELMAEVLRYLNDANCIASFNSMSSDKWKEVVMDLGSSTSVKPEFKDQRELTVRDWIQAEKNLSLKLSLLLSDKEFTTVLCEKKKYADLSERIKIESENLKEDRKLSSVFRIANSVAPLNVDVDFQFKTLKVSMRVPVPTDKTPQGRLGYIRQYLKKAQEHSPEFDALQRDVYCVLNPKLKKIDPRKFFIKELLNKDLTLTKDFDFVNADIVLEYDFGKDIQHAKRFIRIIEQNVISYYANLMQYFEKWVVQTPKATFPKDQTFEQAFEKKPVQEPAYESPSNQSAEQVLGQNNLVEEKTTATEDNIVKESQEQLNTTNQ